MIPHNLSAWQLLIDRVRIIERFGGGGVWNLIQEYDGQEQPDHIAMEQSRAHDRYSKIDLITGQSSVLYCLFLATAIYLSNATGVRYSAIMDIPEPIYRELMHCAFRSGRACEITFQDQAQAYRANNKDHWVLIMALDHPLSIHFMHQAVHLKKYDLTIIPPGPAYSVAYHDKPIHFLRIPIEMVLATPVRHNPLRRLSLPISVPHRRPHESHWLSERLRTATQGKISRGNRTECSAILHMLLSEFLASGFDANLFPHWEVDIPSWLEAFRIQLESRYSDPQLTIPDLMSDFDVSERHLFRVFKQFFSVTPHAYLSQYRISMAGRLLATNIDMKIETISLRCGYRSRSQFIQAFKKETGSTPSQFRQEIESDTIAIS